MMRRVLGAVNDFPLLSAMMFRRGVINDVMACRGVDSVRRREWGCEDLPVIVALASRGPFGYLPVEASAYVVGDSTVSNNRSDGALFDFYVKATTCLVDLIRIYSVDPDSVRENLDSKIRYLAGLASSAFTSERYARLRSLADEWPVAVPVKARLRLAFMRFRR